MITETLQQTCERICGYCAHGCAVVVTSLDPDGKTFIHPDTNDGRKVCLASRHRYNAAETARAGIITVCAWCPQLRVLQIPRRPGMHLAIVLKDDGQIDDVWWLGDSGAPHLQVSHGICDDCRAQHFPSKATPAPPLGTNAGDPANAMEGDA